MVMSLFWHELIEVRRQRIICASPTRTNMNTRTAVEAKHNLLLTEACHTSSIFCLSHAAVGYDVICKPISTCNQEIEGMIKAFIPKSPVTPPPTKKRSAVSLETDEPLLLAPNPDKIQSPGPAAGSAAKSSSQISRKHIFLLRAATREKGTASLSLQQGSIRLALQLHLFLYRPLMETSLRVRH